MEELKKLYDVLVREGKYSKSFEEFQTKWSQDEQYKNKVYDVVVRDKLYSKDKDSFFQKYSVTPPSNVVEDSTLLKKKEDTTVLPSEDGLLESQEFPETPAFNQAQKMQRAPKSEADVFLMEQEKKAKKLQDIFKDVKKQDEELKEQQKIAEDLFDRQTIKPQMGQSSLLRERLSNINKELINREEEFVVPELQYLFDDLGFQFEETGMTGDFMKVKASNNKTIEISLDNFLDSKSEAEADKLKKFIEENTPQKGLFVLENTIREQDKKFNSQKQVDYEIEKVNKDITSLNSKQKEFLSQKSQYESEIAELEKVPVSQRNTNDFANKLNQLEEKRAFLFNDLKSIFQEEELIKQKNKSLEKAVGKYSIAKAKQGTWGGGLRNASLRGFGKISAGVASIGIDILTEILPTEAQLGPNELKEVTIQKSAKLGITPPSENQSIQDWKKTLTPEQLDDWEDEIDDYVKKSAKKDILPATREGLVTLAGDPDTTLEWDNLKKVGFWGGAFLGLAESSAAMIGGAGPAGWAQRTAQMYAQVSDGLAQEMESDPDFADISENEKLLITLPIGITSAALEAYGLRNVVASKGIVNSITMSVLGKSGKNVSAKTFRELVEDEVENRLTKGLLVLGAAGLAEFETGALQEVTETSFKAIYNEIKGKDMFQMPESALDFIENVVVAGGQEAVGGFVLGVPSGVSAAFAQKGFLKMDDATFEMFANIANDENMQSAYIAKLKEGIALGRITTSEAKEQLNNYRNSVGLFRQLPDGLSTQQQKKAMNLLKEKRDLENFVEGKDAALVVKQKNRIVEINESLTELSQQPSAEYIIDNKKYTKEEFINQLEGKTQEELNAMNIVVNNDQETFNIVTEKFKIDAVTKETPEATVKRAERISEIESIISNDDATFAETGNRPLLAEARTELQNELQTLKALEQAETTLETSEVAPETDLKKAKEEIRKQAKEEIRKQAKEEIAKVLDDDVLTEQQQEEKINQIVASAKAQMNVDENDLKLPNIIFQAPTFSLNVSNPFKKKLINLGYTDADISNMTLEQQQDIVINKTQKAEVISSAKVDSVKENERQERITELQRQLDLEIEVETETAIEATPETTGEVRQQTIIEEEVSSKTQPTTKTETQDETRQQSTVQPERTGDGGTRRTPISKNTPLKGTPKVQGATGPNQQLVSVAEKYAAENGIDLKRQGEYVEVDEERAKRIADAYEAMENNPQDPKVKEAYAELIKQTKAQYQALVDAGYKFWFIDLNNPENIDYISSPFNAMRDLRQNKTIGVFPTEEGFGSNEDVDVSQNPLLEDTGIMWAVGGLDGEMKPVTANDLFRAVHDAFGHGLEGAGFRARGEENAFQAHSRLYTGAAVGAMASETRGQNSWVNFGPFGEQNRTASAENTVFADQKVGLMPEFTWTEGLALDMQAETEVAETLAEENVSQRLNEQDLPGYDRMMGEVEGIVEKSKKRRVREAKIADNVMSYVMGSKVYENATDVQREALVREVRKSFGLKEKSAPSVARLFGKIKDVKKITMTEKTALKKQIKDLAKGARDAVRAFRLANQQLSKDIKELRQSGKITADQAANVIRAFSKVNVFSAKSVDRFTTYMTKVFENADYAAKIKEARGLRSNLKKLSKNKDRNANLRVAAAQFVKIDPALIEDIEAYNEMASKIKEAITGSSIRGKKVKFAETVNIQEATDYTSKTLKEQEEKVRQEMIAELQGLLDTDLSELTAEEAGILLGFYGEGKTVDTKKYNESIIRAAIKKAFNVYSSVIKESIKTGKDIFTDEDVKYTNVQKEIINKFMSMDTDKMSAKDSLAAVDSLINFLTNQSTAKMEAVIAKYTGQQNAKKLVNENIFAVALSKLGSRKFGRFLGEQTTNLNVLFEKMFVGFNRATKVMDAIGLTDIINGKSKAQRQTNTIVANYVSKFYNKKANNQKFNTLYNNVERGMVSFVRRNIIGTEAEMKAEFDRRKTLIKESIEVLSNGNEQEINKGLVYQEVYDKIIKDSDDIQSIESKVDPNNLEAINWWAQEWDAKFDELSDTALNIYNKVLDRDLNYSSPDRFTRISYDGGSVDLANTASAFITNTNGNLYKKETGVLMKATRPNQLPKNEDSKEAESYIDLSFDKNNSNSMYDALVDINTAAPIRQVEAFMNTAEFRKIFGVDADLIKGTKSNVGRIQQYIQNIRNKNPYSNDEFSKAMRSLNKIATLGVGQVLAGPTQPLKQVIPVVFNTLINAKGNVDFSAMSNKDFMSWLNESGYAIVNRGVESQADIDSINKMIDEAAESKGAKALKLIENANKKWLSMFLVKPDVWIAVSSWKSYYEQSLRDKGVDVKGIDYSTHKLNKEAANYAQRMVDRQQNASDTDMSGTMFSNRNPYAQTMIKVFMPFASFRMNQSSRLGADLRVLSNWNVSTAEDKKIAARSLSGYAVEMAVFRTLSAGLGIGIASMTASLMGKEDDEEEKKKRRDLLIKGAVTSVVTDVLSPIPVLDRLVQSNSAMIIEGVQKGLGVADEDIKNIYNSRKINFVDALGTFGIAAKRADEVWELVSLSATGTYKDNFGKTKQISEENRQALTKLAAPVLIANITGLASPEVSGVGRNAMKIAKKKDTTLQELKKQRAKDLLGGYENKTDLKRYNSKLYEKNFGKGSDWYESTKEEREAKLKKAKEEREIKDRLYNYTEKDGFGSKKFGKKKSSKKGSGGFGSKKFGAD